MESARLTQGKGIDDGGLSINWGALMKHKHGFTDPVPQSMEDTLRANGVDTMHGTAVFTRQLKSTTAAYPSTGSDLASII